MGSDSGSASAVSAAAAATIADYQAVARGYAEGNMLHDVSQNIHNLLAPLADRRAPLDILDLGCASGRDLVTLAGMGHRAVGLDGVPAFCEMARRLSGCDVMQQDLTQLELPRERYDGIFANACLFHVPSAALAGCLRELEQSLKPGGVLFVSNAHGFGEDREGYTGGRTPRTQSYVCWLSEATWIGYCEAAGLQLLEKYYRPPGKPRSEQPFLATVWRKSDGTADPASAAGIEISTGPAEAGSPTVP